MFPHLVRRLVATQYVKMEIPEYIDEADSNRQQQQHADDGQQVHTEEMLCEGDEDDEEEDEDEQHLEQHSTGGGDHEQDASQTDVTETYGIMEASDLELMYQDHQDQQQQQQQQSSGIGTERSRS